MSIWVNSIPKIFWYAEIIVAYTIKSQQLCQEVNPLLLALRWRTLDTSSIHINLTKLCHNYGVPGMCKVPIVYFTHNLVSLSVSEECLTALSTSLSANPVHSLVCFATFAIKAEIVRFTLLGSFHCSTVSKNCLRSLIPASSPFCAAT